MLASFPSAWAVLESYDFSHPQLQERYQQLLRQLRCPVCPNQALDSSPAPLSADLRRELHQMLEQGYDDQQILQVMVERYGPGVRYSPPINRVTLALWLAPVILPLLGLLLLWLYLRRRAEDD